MPSQVLDRVRPEDVGISTQGLSRLVEVVDQYVDAGEIQGGVTALARLGQLVHYEPHGLMDTAAKRPMARDALFRMASSSKPVLGVAAMIAIEEGLFSPDDAVGRFLPEFAAMEVAVLAEPTDQDVSPAWVFGDVPAHRLVAAVRSITIHDLLTHTSGLASFGLGSAVAGEITIDPDDTLAMVTPRYARMPLDFQPGSRWAYSARIGLDVVARVLEVTSGMTYEAFLEERIFEPLGMRDTHFFVPAEKVERQVVIDGIDPKTKGWDKPSRYAGASGGLISTATDFIRFELMLYHQGELDGRRVVSADSLATMTRNQVGELFLDEGKGEQTGAGFGYTVMIEQDPKMSGSARGAGSFGWGGAFGTMSYTDPENEICAVLLVQQPTKSLGQAFEAAIRDAIID